MTDYTKLVEALRDCASGDDERCFKCTYHKASNMPCHNALMTDAADAIEKLVTLYEKAEMDATNLTGKLTQAEAQLPKRGEWKITTEKFTPELICSKCNVHIPCVAGWCMDAHMNYCPNCGAKMEVQDG